MTSIFAFEIFVTVLAAFIGGVLIALRFRAPALLLASILVFAGATGCALRQDWSLISTLLSAIGVVSLMQGGYLIGSAFFRN
jgi:hypothetical protein